MARESPTHSHKQERVRQEGDKAKVLSSTCPHLVSYFLQLGPTYPPSFQTAQNSAICWMTSSKHKSLCWDNRYSNHNSFTEGTRDCLYRMAFLGQTSETKHVLFKRSQDNTRVQLRSRKHSEKPQCGVQREPEID